MKNLLVIIAAVVLAVLLLLGIYWAIWSVWCWVLPQLWADGPEKLIRPGFWLFFCGAFLTSWFGRLVFRKDSK